MPVETAPQTELEAALRARVRELEASLASMSSELKTVRAERDKLRRAYDQLKAHLELLRRRIFVAKAADRHIAAGDGVRGDDRQAEEAGEGARRRQCRPGRGR